MPKLLIPLILFILFFSATAMSKAKPSQSPSSTPETQPEIPDALDFDRRKAIDHRFELSPYAGDYFGDKLNHTFIVGGNLQFNLTNAFSVCGDFAYSQASVDKTSALGAIFTNNNEYLVDGGFVINMPAAFRSGKSVVEMDFFTSLGGGILIINGSTRGGGYVGGGVKVRPHIRWLAIRVEVRDYFTSINNPGGSDFENSLSIRVGPTFLLPPEL